MRYDIYIYIYVIRRLKVKDHVRVFSMRLLPFPMIQKNLKCSPELDEGTPLCSPPCFMECRRK